MGKDRTSIIIAKDYRILIAKLAYMLLFFVAQVFFFLVNNRKVVNPYDFTTPLDDLIPFLKIFIIPYVYWYAYLAFGFVFFIFKDYKKYFQLLGGILIAEFVAIIIYFFIPSTIQRPVIFGSDFLSMIVEAIYKSDSHFNCLPSLHIAETCLISLFLLRYSKKASMQIFVWISTITICLSTMFVKQHAALDVFVTIILSYAIYYFLECDRLLKGPKIKKILDRIIPQSIRYNFGDFKEEGETNNEKIYWRCEH